MVISPSGQTSPAFVPATSDLDTVCVQSCAGVFAEWLSSNCNDRFTARMLEGMCVFTKGTRSVGPRCRFAFPDAISDLRSDFQAVFSCGLGASPDSCPPACDGALNALIDQLGCCYQSLYNNTEFLRWLMVAGFTNGTAAVTAAENFGRAPENLGRAPEWNLCVDNLPPRCEVIASPPNSSSASPPRSSSGPHLCHHC